MNEREIIRVALEGDAILFLGSGFSVGAQNFTEEGRFLVGKSLCEKMILEGNIDVEGEPEDDKSDLQYIATRYLENNTKRDLLKLLKDLYCCRDVGEEHEIIAKLPWKKIYTTNYDDVMEVASKKVGINREGVEAEKRIGEVYSRKDAIIHINGFINNVKEDDLQDTFKLTQQSYRVKTLPDSDWSVALHTDIKNAKAVIFIGYSLDYDLELQQIFACDGRFKEKSLFVVYNATRRQRTTIGQFGLINEEGLQKFSELVQEVDSDSNIEEKEYNLKFLRVVSVPEKIETTVTSDDLIKLFVDGAVKDEIVFSSNIDRYLFKRKCMQQIFDFITGTGIVAIIHSDLSNGKSILLKQLSTELMAIGTVYVLGEEMGTALADDLEFIANSKGMHYVIVENYNQLIESVAWSIIKRYRYSNVKYIFSARSYINDNFYGRVSRDLELDYNTLGMFDINELKEDDVSSFVDLISLYGVWGENFSKGKEQQRRIIMSKCRSEISNVLLEVYKSPQVAKKVKNIVDNIARDDLAKKVLLYTFICNAISMPVELDDIARVFGVNYINQIFFDKYSELRELLLVEGNKIKIKSSIIAKHVIQKGAYNADILEILNLIVNTFSRHSYLERYAYVLKMIISFSNLRLVFNKNDSSVEEMYILFYENARKTGYYDNNLFFWVQYSIAMMEIKNYDAAWIYLENASSLSTKRYNEDSYQVDSLRARLMLEKTLYDKDQEHAFENFKSAHELICSNKTPELHYPYRQASHYIDFYRLFYPRFTKKEKVEFMFMCTTIKRKISDYISKESGYEKNIRKRNMNIGNIAQDIQEIIDEMARGE